MCRFYGFEFDEVMAMTLRQFSILLNEIGNVLKLECGEENDKSAPQGLTGEQGFKLAKTLFPRRK